MSQRRMFSPDIVCSDAFLDMPASSQALYYQLGMFADDDGFVNPRKIMRMLGSSEDDLKILLAKNFAIGFPDGVLVIKHWRMNNLIRKDWYRPTLYIEHKKTLFLKENKVYTLDSAQGTPLVNESATEDRLVQDRDTLALAAPVVLVKDSPEKPVPLDRRVKEKEKVYRLFNPGRQPWWFHKHQREAALRLYDRGVDKLEAGLQFMRDNSDDKFCPQAHTPFEYEEKLPKINAYKTRKDL